MADLLGLIQVLDAPEMPIEHGLWWNIGIRLLLGLCGIFLYVGFKVKDHLSNFNLSILIKENKAFWIWSTVILITLLLIVTISPSTAEAIKTIIGVDMTNEPSSFFSLGWALSLIANGAVKKKIDKKQI